MGKRRFWLGLSLFLVPLVVYGLTRAPGLTWAHRGADGGDFLAAAAVLGVPHPAGYPTYTLLLRLFMALPGLAPAAAGNLVSVVMGAAAVAFCGAIGQEILGRLARGRDERRWVPWAANCGALCFGLMPLVWSQALITEVYAFQLALTSLALWLLFRWRRTGRGLTWFGLAAGLGMTNHLTAAFLGPAALVMLIGGRQRLMRAPHQRRTRSGVASSPAAAKIRKLRAAATRLLAAGGAFCLGLAPYAYIPWAARRMPPVNWENAQTWDSFLRLVLASRYRHNVLEVAPAEVLARLADWATRLPLAFIWPVYLLLLVGLLWLLLRDPPAGVTSGVFVALSAGYAAGYGTSDYWVNLLPAVLIMAVWLTVGVWLLLRWLGGWRWGSAVGVALTLAAPAALLVSQWGAMDISGDRAAEEFIQHVLEMTEPNALVLARGDQDTFGLWYACYALDHRPDLVPILPTFLRSAWYRKTLMANHEGLDLHSAGLGGEALQTIIQRHLDRRPVYLTWEDDETAANYWLTPVGSLWQVQLPAARERP